MPQDPFIYEIKRAFLNKGLRIGQDGINYGARGSTGRFRAFAEAFSVRVVDGNKLRAVNQRIAELAQQEMLKSYGTWVEGRRSAPSYTRENRFGGGAGRAAMASSAFVRATGSGFQLVNVDLVSQHARHLFRLQAGTAGPKPSGGQRQPQEPPLTFDGVVLIQSLKIPLGERGRMRMPAGHWISPGGGRPMNAQSGKRSNDFFFPGSPKLAGFKPGTRGIGARRFLDEGLVAVAREMPKLYKKHLDESVFEAARVGRIHVVRGRR